MKIRGDSDFSFWETCKIGEYSVRILDWFEE